MPGLIKIEYGSRDKSGVHITDTDKLNVPSKAGEITSSLWCEIP